MYTFSKFVHIVAAICWLGAGVTFQVMNLRAQKSHDDHGAAFLSEQGEWFGQRFFSTAAITTLLAGIVMVVSTDAIGFGDLWITLGFVGIFVSIFLGAVVISRATAQLSEALRTDGPEAPQVAALQQRLNLVGALDMVIVFAVVAVMVYKPG